MKTVHRVLYGDSASVLADLPPESVDLVVTSPPYPMIEMWDEQFARQDGRIKKLIREDGQAGQRAMHALLERVWRAVDAKMKPGAVVCINIGDATRSISGSFRLYSNHSMVIESMVALGYDLLPGILWRKQSNKPNKFLGSGMLPPGGYVTQEHEYVLIFRKRGRRPLTGAAEKRARRESAYFWEERNAWFSDVWEDVRGERQTLRAGGPRRRSAAYPFELAYRLVSMFSVRGDTVLDPFAGTGVTTLSAIASGRNSVSVEVDPNFRSAVESRILGFAGAANEYNARRLQRHVRFANEGRGMRYKNEVYGFPVMTRQETSLELRAVSSITKLRDGSFEAGYSEEVASLDPSG